MSARKMQMERFGSKKYEADAVNAYLRKEITASDLQATLGVTRTYMYRLIRRNEEHGIDGLQSRKLGNRNGAHSDIFRTKVIALITIAGLRKTKLCGFAQVDWAFAAAAYNPVLLPKLLGHWHDPIRSPANGGSSKWNSGIGALSTFSVPARSHLRRSGW